MIRTLFFLAVIVAIGSLLAFVAAQAGEVVLMVAGQRIVLPLFTALCAVMLMVAACLLLWWLVRVIIGAPRAFRHHFGDRRVRRGHQLLSQGLIAAMSGDRQAARRLTRQSQALLSVTQEPLLPLLVAETKRLELDYQGAADVFQSMLDNPQTRLIGLKGLYREAMRKGDDAQAALYAEQAVKIDATLEWAIRATVTQCALEEHWGDALNFLENHDLATRKRRRLPKNKDMAHWHIVLSCASARSLLSTLPQLARDVALRAHKARPDFVPAATIAAQCLLALGEYKKADKLIEAFWRQDPHPDLGRLYIEADGQADAAAKLRRAERLEKLNPNHRNAQFLLAQAALAANELEKARQKAEILAAHSPFEGVFLLLADIHAALGSDESTIRHYLAEAVHAPADFAWMADGQILAQWVAISPLSHRIGGCEWQQPLKQTPPLLALPISESATQPSGTSEIPPDETVSSQAITVVSTKPEIKQEPRPQPSHPAPPLLPPSPQFLPDQEVIENQAHQGSKTGRGNHVTSPASPMPPLTRIVVDDPGIVEDEEKIRF